MLVERAGDRVDLALQLVVAGAVRGGIPMPESPQRGPDRAGSRRRPAPRRGEPLARPAVALGRSPPAFAGVLARLPARRRGARRRRAARRRQPLLGGQRELLVLVGLTVVLAGRVRLVLGPALRGAAARSSCTRRAARAARPVPARPRRSAPSRSSAAAAPRRRGALLARAGALVRGRLGELRVARRPRRRCSAVSSATRSS